MSLIVKIKKNLGTFHLEADFAAEGGISCLLGASGSGKSVTLRCIAGLIKPDEGYIELDGVVFYDSKRGINLSPQERRVGYLFQNYALFPNMSVKQNLLCAMHEETDKSVKEKKIKEMLEFLRLSGYEKRKPGELSGGQMQRIALGRILLNNPRYLLLDEPFSALDYYLKDSLIPQMKEILQSFPHGVLMVTHSREEAYRLAQVAAVIDHGKVLTVKPVKKLFSDPETVEGALVTGCKNIVKAKKTGDYEVFIPDWQVSLTTAVLVADDIKAIGIRAHYFNKSTDVNSHEVEMVDMYEEPFELMIRFRYRNQEAQSQPVWWKMAKDERPRPFPEKIGVAPVNIMLLR